MQYHTSKKIKRECYPIAHVSDVKYRFEYWFTYVFTDVKIKLPLTLHEGKLNPFLKLRILLAII